MTRADGLPRAEHPTAPTPRGTGTPRGRPPGHGRAEEGRTARRPAPSTERAPAPWGDEVEADEEKAAFLVGLRRPVTAPGRHPIEVSPEPGVTRAPGHPAGGSHRQAVTGAGEHAPTLPPAAPGPAGPPPLAPVELAAGAVQGGALRGGPRAPRGPAKAPTAPAPGTPRGRAGTPCPKMSGALISRCGGCGTVGAVPVGCETLACASCQAVVSHRRGDRLYTSVGGVPLIGWVATVPPELAAALDWRGAARMRAAFVALLQRLYLEVARWDGLRGSSRQLERLGADGELAIGVGAAIHPEGDERPGEWRPHVHAEIPALAVADRRRLRELPVKLAPHRLALAKRWWMEWMKAEADAQGVALKPESQANLHLSFRRKPEEVRHRCRYDWRSFPAWAAGPEVPGRRGAQSPRRYGLLAPRADRLAELGPLERWREALRAPPDEHEAPRCRAPVGEGPDGRPIACGCELEGRPEWWAGSKMLIELRIAAEGAPVWWHCPTLEPPDDGPQVPRLKIPGFRERTKPG